MRHFEELKVGGECGREVVTPLVTSVNLWKGRTNRTRKELSERQRLKTLENVILN